MHPQNAAVRALESNCVVKTRVTSCDVELFFRWRLELRLSQKKTPQLGLPCDLAGLRINLNVFPVRLY